MRKKEGRGVFFRFYLDLDLKNMELPLCVIFCYIFLEKARFWKTGCKESAGAVADRGWMFGRQCVLDLDIVASQGNSQVRRPDSAKYILQEEVLDFLLVYLHRPGAVIQLSLLALY